MCREKKRMLFCTISLFLAPDFCVHSFVGLFFSPAAGVPSPGPPPSTSARVNPHKSVIVAAVLYTASKLSILNISARSMNTLLSLYTITPWSYCFACGPVPLRICRDPASAQGSACTTARSALPPSVPALPAIALLCIARVVCFCRPLNATRAARHP